jgi:hypothetical protein
MPISEQADESEDVDPGETQSGFAAPFRSVPLRMRQLRFEAQTQLADAQKSLARATVKSARYMLWATVVCTVSSVITVVAVLYGVLVVLPHLAH